MYAALAQHLPKKKGEIKRWMNATNWWKHDSRRRLTMISFHNILETTNVFDFHIIYAYEII